MKKHEIVTQHLIDIGIIPDYDQFEVTDSLIDIYVKSYGDLFTKKNGKLKTSNERYARKLAALSLFKLNESRVSVILDSKKSKIKSKSGFVYAIENPAFPEHYKIGITRNLYKRLDTYQTYDPHRAYRVAHYRFHEDVRSEEKRLLQSSLVDSGEWILRKDIHKFFA